MKLTDKRKAILKLLESGTPRLLTGTQCISARGMKHYGLVEYKGLNHYVITDEGRAVLEREANDH